MVSYIFILPLFSLLALTHCLDDDDITKSPCATHDTVCLNSMAVKYVNDIRRAGGQPPLNVGTKAMLDNAMRHSEIMKGRDNIFHQDIGSVIVARGAACQTSLSSENVAMYMDSRVRNAAAQCVIQWRDSPGHYKNIMRSGNDNTVIGIYVAPDRTVWCTQTFSRLRSTAVSGECAKPSTSGTAAPLIIAPSPTPAARAAPSSPQAPMPAVATKMRHRRIGVTLQDGTWRGLIENCKSGECVYCRYGPKRNCFSADESRKLDQILTEYRI